MCIDTGRKYNHRPRYISPNSSIKLGNEGHQGIVNSCEKVLICQNSQKRKHNFKRDVSRAEPVMDFCGPVRYQQIESGII